jgi:hypothetical protein
MANNPPSEEMVPGFIFDIMSEVYEAQAKKMLQSQEETLERVKYGSTMQWAMLIRILEMIVQILDHPAGGPEKAKQLIAQQIELIKGFDQDG